MIVTAFALVAVLVVHHHLDRFLAAVHKLADDMKSSQEGDSQ